MSEKKKEEKKVGKPERLKKVGRPSKKSGNLPEKLHPKRPNLNLRNTSNPWNAPNWLKKNGNKGGVKKRLDKEYAMIKEEEMLNSIVAMEEMGDEVEPVELERVKERLDEIAETRKETKELAQTPPRRWWSTMDIKETMYPNLQLTKEEQRRVEVSARFLKTGLASQVPMTCTGRNKCPFARGWERGGGHCEYAKIQKEPLGKPCIVEMDFIIDRTQAYAAQFEVGSLPDEAVDRLQCMELAEYDVYERRVTLALAEGQAVELVEENCIGMDEAENPIFARQIALAWHIKIQLKNRRDRVLRSLVATREAKYKRDAAMGTKEETDHATGFGQMMGILKGMQPVVDAEFSEDS